MQIVHLVAFVMDLCDTYKNHGLAFVIFFLFSYNILSTSVQSDFVVLKSHSK